MITRLNQKARRAKAKGETLRLSLDDVSAQLGIDKLRYVDEVELVSDLIENASQSKHLYSCV